MKTKCATPGILSSSLRIPFALGVCCVGFLVALVAFAQGKNRNPQDAVQAGFRVHISRAVEPVAHGPAELLSEGAQAAVPASATRSSFMARWKSVARAKSYRLDVSTSPLFDTFVEGYHDLDVGNVTGRVVTGLTRGTTYYYRVRSYDDSGTSTDSATTSATTTPTTGLVINATFDSSILNDPNAAAIEAMINRAISIEESLFSDPVTIRIAFRWTTSADPCGPVGGLAQSCTSIYDIPWDTFISALRADTKTSNDNTANASLPSTALSTDISISSANGRAVGINTLGSIQYNGGTYDATITLNPTEPWQFTRPTSPSYYDAQRTVEHEMDEVMGLGSNITDSSNYQPQDLFSWSSPGVRSFSSSGIRYFSIDSGNMNIVRFNQDPNGDFGDWFSESCPQAHPYVQNAFVCVGQSSDVAVTSPEGINLDVIGYDLVTGSWAVRALGDFNRDLKPDFVLYQAETRRTMVWYMNNNVVTSSSTGPTIAAGWNIVDSADFNRDGKPDYLLFDPATRRTAIWYLSGTTFAYAAYGPTIPAGWEPIATGDFNGDGRPDYLLYRASTHQAAIWYMNNNSFVSGAYAPTLPDGWEVVDVADFNRDSKLDYLLYQPATRRTAIWYLNNNAFLGSAYGPTSAPGWVPLRARDFNGDGHPDYLLFNSSTRRTAIWYLNNNIFLNSAYGPTLPAG